MPPRELAPGLVLHRGYLDADARVHLADELQRLLERAPPYTPRMPRSGRPFSVRMTNCGPLGWVSDETGYRYQPTHPETGNSWPPIPAIALQAWHDLASCPAPPEACLVNLYAPGTRMGLHQDRDETDFAAPVLSLSLGAAALFRFGGTRRSDPTRSVRLESGDALVMGGASRLAFHGIDRLFAQDADLVAGSADALSPHFLAPFLPAGGRCNLTLRRVNRLPTAAGA